jgi:arylsulfatase A-like enzyme
VCDAPNQAARPIFAQRNKSRERSFSPWSALILAAWFGLLGGYLDLTAIFLKRDWFHASLYYEQGRNFRWVVPIASLVVMLVPGLVVAGASALKPQLVSLRPAVWIFATLALWGPLLRTPLYGVATLLLAGGIAHGISRWIAKRASAFERVARWSLPALLALVAATMVVSLGRHALAEMRAMARLPAPPAAATNVLLIVMDTVRAENLGLYGYRRDTTPHLARWARKAVRFEWALAPAPWTFPSHGSFFTGQWPSMLGAHWQPVLDPAFPTLAGFLASRGYLTAGFAANTHWCSYESGMDQGFVHYEDYPLAPRTLLGSTMLGRWALENVFHPRGFYHVKWIRSQSRDGAEINRAFLDWLPRQRNAKRPFFAFLNYLDAHEPFLPPEGSGPHFGLRPESAADHKLLTEYWDRDKLALRPRDIELVRDSYDDCIAALDRQVGLLLAQLEKSGVLRDTLVIITSDHGEEFGEHGVFNHGFSVYTHEVHVPLLVISRAAPAGRTIDEPVSLRDLPATVVDLLGIGDRSGFPGHSLADHWRLPGGAGERLGAPAFSEVDIPVVIIPQRGRGPNQRGFTVSLVADRLHYLLDVQGTEELYDLAADPLELRDLKNDPGRSPALARFRNSLALILREHKGATGAAAGYLKQLKIFLDSRAPKPSMPNF